MNRSLEFCIQHFFDQEEHIQNQVALNKADWCRKISKEAANLANWRSLKRFITNNGHLLKSYNEI